MRNIDTLYEKIKDKKDGSINNILKDIIVIDGAIVQETNLEYKKNIYITLEEKYKKDLEELMYHKVKDIVDEKTDMYVESQIKTINTQLGNLKNMLIRVVGTKMYTNNKVDEIKRELKKQNNPKQIYELYLDLDDILVKHVR